MVVVRGLTKHYRGVAALDDCTLEVRRGEVFGLLGPNGSGKTTLLRLLMGFLRPTRGSAQVGSFDCYRQSTKVHAGTSYLPGDARLFPRMRGRAVLQFFSRVRPDGDLARALDVAKRLRIDLSRPVAMCSTGMRQKLALAASLAAKTALVILDEPTSNLDPTVRGEVLALVREARSEGRTVIFSSHVLSEVEHVCDRVAVLRSGRLAHIQVLAELRRQHRIRARLTGDLPPPPAGLDDELEIHANGDGHVTIQTPGELAPLLSWLAGLPLAEVRIEPLGLQAVYDRFHAADSVEGA